MGDDFGRAIQEAKGIREVEKLKRRLERAEASLSNILDSQDGREAWSIAGEYFRGRVKEIVKEIADG